MNSDYFNFVSLSQYLLTMYADQKFKIIVYIKKEISIFWTFYLNTNVYRH